MNKIGKRRIVVALAVVFSLFIVGLALSASPVAVTSEIGSEGLPLLASDLSAVPQSVTEDATKLATELLGEGQEECDDFVNQLLGAYLEAKDKDFVIVFNPGGWGWNIIEKTPGWWSISTGIESELNSSGYTSLFLNYQRTVDTFQGRFNELGEMITGYSSKAEELAYRVEFLTTHIPNIRVIIAGESLGTVISDRAMNILADNPQVYSIQTGPPFWHDNIMLNRTLVMTDNGINPDSFSQGDFRTIIIGNLKSFFGLSQPREDFGTILHHVGAPGHDYWWQYPQVYSEVTKFLEQNFSIEW